MTDKAEIDRERIKFEEFWRRTMNIEVLDLHRCEFPMVADWRQPYACHETDRAWITWIARSRLNNWPPRININASGIRITGNSDGSLTINSTNPESSCLGVVCEKSGTLGKDAGLRKSTIKPFEYKP